MLENLSLWGKKAAVESPPRPKVSILPESGDSKFAGKGCVFSAVPPLPGGRGRRAAVLPLSKKLSEDALKVYEKLQKKFMVDFDETGSIGKRYRREDEIGTPLCITFDFESLEDNCVTVRDRDTMQQERISIDALEDYIASRIEF